MQQLYQPDAHSEVALTDSKVERGRRVWLLASSFVILIYVWLPSKSMYVYKLYRDTRRMLVPRRFNLNDIRSLGTYAIKVTGLFRG